MAQPPNLPFRSHTALLLATALPFLNPSLRHPLELMIKVMELSETVKLYQSFHPTSSTLFPGSFHSSQNSSEKEQTGLWGLIQKYISDPEGLLTSLATVCTGKEKEIVSLLLTLLQAKSIYENYGDILSSFMTSDAPDFSFMQNMAGAPDFSFMQNMTSTSNTASVPETPSGSDMPFTQNTVSTPDMISQPSPRDLASMLTPEQTDTINLLKSLLDADE